MSEELIGGALAISQTIIRKILTGTSDVHIIKSVVINGVENSIHFVSRFIKGSNSKKTFVKKLKKWFSDKSIELDEQYRIRISDCYGNDITDTIIELEKNKKIIPFSNFIDYLFGNLEFVRCFALTGDIIFSFGFGFF